MTTKSVNSDKMLSALFSVAIDLTKSLTSAERFERLLVSAKQVIPCDAAAILKLENDRLRPVVVDGLKPSTIAKRFQLSHHPRLQAILNSDGVIKFKPASEMPDPYDGLVESCRGDLPVHACMGAALKVDEEVWGVITFDALDPTAFESTNENLVAAFSALAAAAASSASYIEALETSVSRQQQVSHNLIEQILGHQGEEMIGESEAMNQLRDEISMVASSDLNVLITGETGTGKELVARAIHRNSQRKSQPIVYLNCSSLPENLAESELFGHKKGAFTGAVKDYKGKFELADKGTLFLDEIGELALSLQAKLLRVLQSGEVQPLGEEHMRYVDVRVIAATNRNLKDEVREGNFRRDLFHRLGVYPITVPSLRERIHDIQLLADYFVEKLSRKFGVRGVSLDSSAIKALNAYLWPGNIRELEHLISRALLKLSSNSHQRINRLFAADFNFSSDELASFNNDSTEVAQSQDLSNLSTNLNTETENFQRKLIEKYLSMNQKNWSKTAENLGLDRSNLHRLAKRLGLK